MKYAEEEEDGNVHAIFRNGNPEEMYPMWIEKTDDMRAFGGVILLFISMHLILRYRIVLKIL